MNKTSGMVDRIKMGLGIALLAALTGCYGGGGYVGGYYGGAVVVTEPDVYVFGGVYEGGRDVHDYSRRGSESRAVAHPGGGPARSPQPMRPAGGGPGGKR